MLLLISVSVWNTKAPLRLSKHGSLWQMTNSTSVSYSSDCKSMWPACQEFIVRVHSATQNKWSPTMIFVLNSLQDVVSAEPHTHKCRKWCYCWIHFLQDNVPLCFSFCRKTCRSLKSAFLISFCWYHCLANKRKTWCVGRNRCRQTSLHLERGASLRRWITRCGPDKVPVAPLTNTF